MKFVKVIAGVVLVACVCLLLIGVFVPETHYELEVRIDSPRQEVFSIFNSPETMPHWIEGFKSMELLSGEQGKNGATYRMTVMSDGKEISVTQNVVKQIEAESCEYLVTDEHMSNKVLITFKDDGTGTLIHVSKFFTGRKMLSRCMLPLLNSSLRDQDIRQFEMLRAYIETR
jgi:uncharacterized membrane protein